LLKEEAQWSVIPSST